MSIFVARLARYTADAYHTETVMKQLKPAIRELPDYVVAPWHRRVRWWLVAQYWCWCRSCDVSGAESPEQINLWWRR